MAPGPDPHFELAQALAAAGEDFYRRGWVLGTSGNFSALLGREPLRMLITPSGAHKGSLSADQLLGTDAAGNVWRASGRPSAETSLHVAIYQNRPDARAVFHTHSVWSTLLSAHEDGVWIEGFEMLKGLSGVATHQHRERLPIVDNSQDYAALSAEVSAVLASNPDAHGFLLRQHGLYTWGFDVSEARRHVEILEFLFEVLGRSGKV